MTDPALLSARLDVAGRVVAKLIKRIDQVETQYTKLNQDFMELHSRMVQLDNRVLLLNERVDARAKLQGDLIQEHGRIIKSLGQHHDLIQELLRFKHDTEARDEQIARAKPSQSTTGNGQTARSTGPARRTQTPEPLHDRLPAKDQK